MTFNFICMCMMVSSFSVILSPLSIISNIWSDQSWPCPSCCQNLDQIKSKETRPLCGALWQKKIFLPPKKVKTLVKIFGIAKIGEKWLNMGVHFFFFEGVPNRTNTFFLKTVLKEE